MLRQRKTHIDHPRQAMADPSVKLFSSARTPPDILLLYAARALRGLGDGFAAILLPVYLSAIGLSAQQVGIVASASLLGTAALTLITGFIAPRFELRTLFLAGAGLIALTGLVFPATETIGPVLLVAFIGSINPSSGDLGMLIPLEHAPADQGDGRPRPHAHIRAIQPDRLADVSRRIPGGGVARDARIPRLAGTGCDQADVLLLWNAGAACGLALSASAARPQPRRHRAQGRARPIEKHRLQAGRPVQPRCLRWRLRRPIAAGALAVPAVRPVAGGGEPVSSSGASLLGAMSFPVAAWLAGRIGLVNTMVFTHIPVERLPDRWRRFRQT